MLAVLAVCHGRLAWFEGAAHVNRTVVINVTFDATFIDPVLVIDPVDRLMTAEIERDLVDPVLSTKTTERESFTFGHSL